MQISRESTPAKAHAAIKCSTSITLEVSFARIVQLSVETTLKGLAKIGFSHPSTKNLIPFSFDGKSVTAQSLPVIKVFPDILISFLIDAINN